MHSQAYCNCLKKEMNLLFVFCFILKLWLLKSEVIDKVFDFESLPDAVDLSFDKKEPIGSVVDNEKSIVVILHGIMASKKYWIPICEEISIKTNRSCFALDLREHGKS